jgi:hypothetical protein
MSKVCEKPFVSSTASICRLARQLARNGTARFGANFRVPEVSDHQDKKRGGAFEHPRNRWDGYLPLLAALFLSTLFRHSSSLKLERSAEKPGTEVSLRVV